MPSITHIALAWLAAAIVMALILLPDVIAEWRKEAREHDEHAEPYLQPWERKP